MTAKRFDSVGNCIFNIFATVPQTFFHNLNHSKRLRIVLLFLPCAPPISMVDTKFEIYFSFCKVSNT
jgi:hypothetical protein